MITVQPGDYNDGVTLTGTASLYQKDNNNIIACLEVDFSGPKLKAYITLYTNKDGIKQKAVEKMKAIFTEWDGDLGNLYDLLNSNGESFAGRQVSATVGVTEKDGKQYSNIEWLNPYGSGGGGGAMPKPGDKKAMLAKFGAKFRALNGGKSVKPAPSKPASPKAPPAPPKPAKVSSQEACWERINALMASAKEDEVTAAWFQYCEKAVAGKEQNEFTPEDWGRVLETIDTETLPN